jgi:hypothetical protein
MIHKQLLAAVKQGIYDYENDRHDFFPSYAPTQKEVLSLIDLYWVDKFRDGDTNKEGWKRAFYQYGRSPTLTSAKQTDFDTKDVILMPMPGMDVHRTWLAQIDLQQWMKKRDFGKLLNQVVYDLPKYGSVVLQKIGDEIFNVPLRNLAMDVDENKLKDMEAIIQTHEFLPSQLRKMSWENVETAIADAEGDCITVYSFFGTVLGETKNYWVCDSKGNVLYSKKFDSVDELYRKCDWESLHGRALGRGVMETLFEAQVQINRVQNYKTEGLHWSSKHIFQTRDTNIRKNLMTDVENGDIMSVVSELTPIANEERNLHAYREEEARWDLLQQRSTFAFAEMAGERPPAGTPLGTTQIQTMQNASYFDLKREDIGMFWSDIIEDWVLPTHNKETKKHHTILFSQMPPEDLERVRSLMETNLYNESVFDFVGKSGKLPTAEEAAFLKQVASAEMLTKKELDIPESYYSDLQYTVRVVMTNEALDVGAKMSTYQTLMAMKAQNPNVFNDPSTRGLINKMLALVGESPLSMGFDTTPQQVGGSIPSPQATPSMTPRQQIL